jgi:hypothetical protein
MDPRYGAGLHTAPGRTVDAAAYEQYIGRWSRLFVPAVLAAAEVTGGCRVLDVATGQMPQAYLALPESGRRAVRDEVQARLAEFESGGRLVMIVEMLIAAGRT